jgi:cytochrome c-type biogenesis protein CcmH/NrfG
MPIDLQAFEKVVDRKMTLAQALGLSPNVVEVFALLGSQCYEQGRYHDARSMFQAAASLDDNNYLGHAGLGALELVEDNIDAALVNLRRAYELNSKDPAVCGNLGEALVRKGQNTEATKYLSESAALDPAHTNPYANRARGILQAIRGA